MALPFVLWGAAALLAGTGVVKGVGAMSDFDDAKHIGENAEQKFQNADASLQYARDQTNSAFEKLDRTKMHIFNHQVEVIKKSKNASSKLAGFEQTISVEELKEMDRLVMASLEIENGLGSGAATGALAAWGAYGGVMALGTASTGTTIDALSAGGFGMAGGALALGGIVLGPALAVGGFMMASKAEVDITVAEMKKVEIVLQALRANATEMQSTLTQLAQRFDAIKVNNDSNIEAFNQMMVVGKGLKDVLNVAIMDKDGGATKTLKSKISGYLEV